jgi:hypothetical protein
MPILSKPSAAARTSLTYITIGTLMVVWTGVHFAYLHKHPPESGHDSVYYWVSGFMITGLALLIIGLAVGQIGRQARHAELPPPEVTQAEANVEQKAASRAPIVAPVNPAAPAMTAQGLGNAPPAPNVAPAAPVAVAPPAATVPRT